MKRYLRLCDIPREQVVLGLKIASDVDPDNRLGEFTEVSGDSFNLGKVTFRNRDGTGFSRTGHVRVGSICRVLDNEGNPIEIL